MDIIRKLDILCICSTFKRKNAFTLVKMENIKFKEYVFINKGMTFFVDDVQFRIDLIEIVAVLSFRQNLIGLDSFIA